MTHACPLENWTSHTAQKHINKMKHRNKKCLCPLNCYKYNWEGTGIHSIKFPLMEMLLTLTFGTYKLYTGIHWWEWVCMPALHFDMPLQLVLLLSLINGALSSKMSWKHNQLIDYPLYLELCPEFAKIRSLYFTHFLLLTAIIISSTTLRSPLSCLFFHYSMLLS